MPDWRLSLPTTSRGWYAGWNVLMKARSRTFTAATRGAGGRFHAFDDPHRNVLVLFKLHPWPDGRVYDPADENLRVRFPEDSFTVPLK